MAGRTRAGGIAVTLLAAVLVVSSSPAAFADGPVVSPSPTPTPTATSTPTDPAAARILHDLAIRIVALQRKAEQLGEVAQKAGEKSNAAEAASKAADQQLAEAR